MLKTHIWPLFWKTLWFRRREKRRCTNTSAHTHMQDCEGKEQSTVDTVMEGRGNFLRKFLCGVEDWALGPGCGDAQAPRRDEEAWDIPATERAPRGSRVEVERKLAPTEVGDVAELQRLTTWGSSFFSGAAVMRTASRAQRQICFNSMAGRDWTMAWLVQEEMTAEKSGQLLMDQAA